MAATIKSFLETHLVSELIADKGPLVEVNGDTSIEDTLKTITDHNILSVAVYKENSSGKQYLGIISIWEIMSYVVFTGYFSSSVDPPAVDPKDYDSIHFPSEPIWKLIGTSTEGKDLWIYRPEDTIKAIMEPLCKGVHRVLVGPLTRADIAPPVANLNRSYVLLTQTDVIKWIFKNVESFGELTNRTLENLGLVDIQHGPSKLKTFPNSKTAIEGFRKLFSDDLSALPVLDAASGLLRTTISASDLRGIDNSKLKWVLLPVEEFLRNQLNGALPAPVICTARTTFQEALKEALNARVHRLWAIDVHEHPIGVVTFSDLIGVAFHAK